MSSSAAVHRRSAKRDFAPIESANSRTRLTASSRSRELCTTISRDCDPHEKYLAMPKMSRLRIFWMVTSSSSFNGSAFLASMFVRP